MYVFVTFDRKHMRPPVTKITVLRLEKTLSKPTILIPYDKIHASGNDFVLCSQELSRHQIGQICKRHLGVGADGVMIVEGIEQERVRFGHFDPDGSRSFCLNGIRSGLKALFEKGKIPIKGMVESEGVRLDYEVQEHVAVGLPKKPFRPMVWKQGQEDVSGFYCDVGNPHFICWELPALDFRQIAPRIRADFETFPGGTNVNWLEKKDHGWRIDTYERGVESFTLSCGSGMYASALVLSQEFGKSDLSFFPQGGDEVSIRWKHDMLWLSGPTHWVAEGAWRC